MPIRNHIEDGGGSGKLTDVTPREALKVQPLPETAVGIPQKVLTALLVEREYLTDSAGSSNLNVDGSVTAVDFTIEAEPTLTKWITGFDVLFEDGNLDMASTEFRRFGDATAANTPLTNGVLIFAEQSGIITNIAVDPITVMGDFFNYADSYVNLVNAIATNVDFLRWTFMLDKPIVIPAGTQDRFVFTIRDNLTAMSSFKVIARGYKELV